jgi:hypothetical protein
VNPPETCRSLRIRKVHSYGEDEALDGGVLAGMQPALPHRSNFNARLITFPMCAAARADLRASKEWFFRQVFICF